MIKKENYIFGLISNTENHILEVLFFLIVFLGQTFISLDIPPTYNKYYNISSQSNFIINSTDVNYDLFTFLIDCLSRCGQKKEVIFLYQHEASLKTLMLHLPTAPKSLFFLIRMSSRYEK